MSADRITVDDVRKAGFCISGLRQWTGAHSIDLRAFIRDGIERSKIEPIDDALVRRVLDVKDARE